MSRAVIAIRFRMANHSRLDRGCKPVFDQTRKGKQNETSERLVRRFADTKGRRQEFEMKLFACGPEVRRGGYDVANG
jgi:hypothetical protein